MKQKLLLLIGFFLVSFLSGYGQTYSVFKEVQDRKTNRSLGIKSPDLHSNDAVFKKNISLSKNFKSVFFDEQDMQILAYDAQQIFDKRKTIKGGILSLKIPYKNTFFEIEAFEIEEQLDDFKVTDSKGRAVVVDLKMKHFSGVLKDDEKSLVSLTFFDDEVNGFISSSVLGDFNIEKLKNSTLMVVFPIDNIKEVGGFECKERERATKDTVIIDAELDIEKNNVLNKCTSLYFETAYNIFQENGSSFNTVSRYVRKIYNQVATLYYNEGIKTRISEIRIWDTPSPFNTSDLYDLLDSFTDTRHHFNGDLAMLLTYGSGASGVAYVDGLCASDVKYRKGATIINRNDNFDAFSFYSRSVKVVSHEFGHLFGSNHTHACKWNGNNTVIDGCAAPEGNCNSGSIPALGTIMSYCDHLSNSSVHFSMGFGPQPGDVMRYRVSTANCLGSCTICFEDLTIFKTVPWNDYARVSAKSLNAINVIQGNAVYTASDYILLRPGFHAKEGAYFNTYIAYCVGEKTLTSSTDLDVISNNLLVEEDKATKKLIIHPNPTSGTFYISYPYDDVNTYYIEIYGIKGKKVHEQKLSSKNNKVVLEQADKGVYSIRFYENKHVVLDKLILK